MHHGVARVGTSLPGWRSWKRRRLLIVLPQVRILPLVQRRRQVERAQPSEGRACWFESSRRYDFWSGTHLGSEAAVYRPRRVRFSSGPLTTPGYPNQQRTPAQTRCVAGANPVPGTDGRVAQRQCSRLMSGRREVRLLPRLLRDPLARHAGSDPAARRFESVSRDHATRV